MTEHPRWPKKGASNQSEKSIAAWLGKQRVAVRKGSLAPERLAALDALSARVGIDWHPNRGGADV